MKKIYILAMALLCLGINTLHAQTTFSGQPQTLIVETSDSTMLLPASNAVDGGITYSSYSGAINGWGAGNVTWKIQITRPSNITIYANYTSGYDDAGLTVNVNGTTINAAALGTGGWGTFLDRAVGQITLQPGIYTFSLGVTNNAMNFSHVRLTRQIVPLTLTTLTNNANFGFVVKSPYRTVYEIGDTVLVKAIPYAGYGFQNWNSSSINAVDTIVMSGNKTVTANFAKGGTVFPDGMGVITLPAPLAKLDTSGIVLGDSIITSWTMGTAVWQVEVQCPTMYIIRGNISGSNSSLHGSLHITIDSTVLGGNYTTTGNGFNSYAYQNFCGALLQSGTHTVKISRVIESGVDNTINLKTLQFVQDTSNGFLLSLKVNNSSMGNVTASPIKIIYNSGDTVVISAVANPNYQFTAWSGDLVSTKRTDTIIMNANKTITANFAPITYTLTLSSNNPTYGTANALPNQTTFNAGDTVIITANPNAGYQFVSWSGDLVSTKIIDTIVMTGNKSIQAEFEVITSIAQLSESSLHFYPNPFNDIIYIEFSKSLDIYRIEIINEKGTSMKSFMLNSSYNNSVVLQGKELSELSQGVYLIRVTAQNQIISHKMVKVSAY